MIYCFDIDGTICTKVLHAKYETAKPFRHRITHINYLFECGHTIKLFTARGSTTGINWRELTENQLHEWGLNYHELLFGKPEADIYVDDRGQQDSVYPWS